MNLFSNEKLLKAKSIIQRAWIEGALIDETDDGEVGYCALGAIGKAYEDTGLELDNDMWYGSIPVEDVVVLAYEINPEGVDELIEALKQGKNNPETIYSYVFDYNDESNREEVAATFNGACKNYSKHEHKILEFWEATYIYDGIRGNTEHINFVHYEELAKEAGIVLS